MDETESATPLTGSTPKKTGRGMLWALLAVVIAFFVGFFWQWYEASTVRDQLAAVEAELEVERLRVHLGQAALAAQAGDYESARRQMSSFFTELQGTGDDLPDQVAAVATDFLDVRDDVITGLSRSNPEYAGVLYGMLGQLGSAVEQAGMGGGGAMPAAPAGSEGPADAGTDTGPAALEPQPEAPGTEPESTAAEPVTVDTLP